MRKHSPALALLFLATPAHAWEGTPIPEPSNLALFGLGVLGLIVGRRAASKRRKRD